IHRTNARDDPTKSQADPRLSPRTRRRRQRASRTTFFTGLSGYGPSPDADDSCGIAPALGAPVRTGAHIGAQNGAHIGAQNGAPPSVRSTDRLLAPSPPRPLSGRSYSNPPHGPGAR